MYFEVKAITFCWQMKCGPEKKEDRMWLQYFGSDLQLSYWVWNTFLKEREAEVVNLIYLILFFFQFILFYFC